jgi:hypothetical protein
MRIGTKGVLAGAHCFFLHPWFVALTWWKLCGFPLAVFSNSTPTNLPLGATAEKGLKVLSPVAHQHKWGPVEGVCEAGGGRIALVQFETPAFRIGF